MLAAQTFFGFATEWSDDLSQWEVFYLDQEGDEQVGRLELRWPLKGDWTEWKFELGELEGSIDVRWRNNPAEWELRSDDLTISARSVWANDISSWRISGGNNQIVLESRYGNTRESWQLRSSQFGSFNLQTSWEGDIREWEIQDELDEAIHPELKILCMFLVIYYNLPD